MTSTAYHNGLCEFDERRIARGNLYIGSEPATPEAFRARCHDAALERVAMAKRITLARLLPFDEVLDAMRDDDSVAIDDEVIELAFESIMQAA